MTLTYSDGTLTRIVNVNVHITIAHYERASEFLNFISTVMKTRGARVSAIFTRVDNHTMLLLVYENRHRQYQRHRPIFADAQVTK